jgi:hypothetical protein
MATSDITGKSNDHGGSDDNDHCRRPLGVWADERGQPDDIIAACGFVLGSVLVIIGAVLPTARLATCIFLTGIIMMLMTSTFVHVANLEACYNRRLALSPLQKGDKVDLLGRRGVVVHVELAPRASDMTAVETER